MPGASDLIVGKVGVGVEFDTRELGRQARGELRRQSEAIAKDMGSRMGSVTAKELIDALEQRFRRDIGDAKEQLARGLIDQDEFEESGRRAARSFNESLLKEIKKRAQAGQLAQADSIQLTNALKEQGIRGAKAFRDPFEKVVDFFRGGFRIAAVAAVAFVATRVIRAGRRIGAAIRDFLTEAGNFQQARGGFERSALSAGLDPDRVLDELRQGLRGTVRDAELFVLAQQAIQNELPITEESMGRLATVARRLAESTGRDVPDSLRRMIRGIAKVEPELLDEIGIVTRLETALREWEKQTGRNSDALTQAEKTVIFFNAVLEEGERKVRNLGAESFSARRPIDQLTAAVANFRSRLAEAVVESPKLVELLTLLGDSAEDSADRLERSVIDIASAVDAYLEVLTSRLAEDKISGRFLRFLFNIAVPDFGPAFEKARQQRLEIQQLREQGQDRIREIQQETDPATLILESARVRAEIEELQIRLEVAAEERAQLEGEELEVLDQKVRIDRERLKILQDQEAAVKGRLEQVTGEGEGSDPVDPQELLRQVQARARLRLATIEADVAEEIRGLDRQLEEAAISFEEFYDRLEEQALRPIEAQRQILQEQRRLVTSDTARATIDAQLAELESQRAEVVARFAQERAAAERKYRDEVLAIQRELLEATGRSAEARRQVIQERFDDILARARAQADEEAIQSIERAREIALARVNFDEVLQATRTAREELEREIEAADIALEEGTISREERFERVADAIQATRAEVAGMLPELREWAELIGDPALVAVIEELELEMERLGLETKETVDVWREFSDDAFRGATSAFTEFFTRGIREAESFGDAMRSLALSVVESIQRIIAQMLALRIVQAIFGALNLPVPQARDGGLVGSRGTSASDLGRGSTGTRAASGGLIRGPGGPRDDKVPALLSNGEFVVRAAVVDRYGADFFHRLNQGPAIPAPPSPAPVTVRMADGGLVRGGGSTSEVLNGRMEVGLEEGLVLRMLETNEGQRVLLKTIGKNRSAVRRALGLG